MPTYKYHCKSCGASLEKLQKITDEPLKDCPSCGKAELQRGPGGGIGLSFTGSGFYVTDYASSGDKEKNPSNPPSSKECCPCGKNKTSCSTPEK